MAQQKNVLSSLLSAINDLRFDDLDRFLKNDVEWESVGDILIIPQQVRKFIKSIQDKEARMDVARFLHKYARQYFREAAEGMENKEREEGFLAVGPDIPIKTAEERIALFQQELAFLLDQDESTGEFSGNKFKMQQERIKQLEKQVEDLVAKNAQLEEKIYAYEHRGDGHFIPAKLISYEFNHIIQLLVQKQLISVHHKVNDYGYQQVSHLTWNGQYDLFGYFVDKISYELELRDSGGRLNWKLFRDAFDNYKKMERAAKNAVSLYQNHSDAKLPEDADVIDEILKIASAYEAERQTKEKHT